MKTQCAAAILTLLPGLALAQDRVQMVVTVEARHGASVPVLAREDVLVFQGQDRRNVVGWVPYQGDNAGLELFILLDDASETSLASQFPEIHDFINAQPLATAIGIGYMRNGIVDTVQPLTTDRAQIIRKLRLPMDSSTVGNPYLSLSELIRKWPAGATRREVVLITPGGGAFNLGEEGFHNIFVDAAIADAQRAGVIVHAIYALGAGHSGHSPWQNLWARHYLARVAAETGGEAYSLGFGAPVSLTPYLSEIGFRLAHQYLLTFIATPGEPGKAQSVRVVTEIPNADIVAAPKFYISGP